MTRPFPNSEELERWQCEQLRDLFGEILPANPFYTKKLAHCNGLKNLASLEPFFQSVPFTTKAEIVEDQKLHPPYGSNLTYALEHYSRLHQTSGTSGTPLRWLDTNGTWEWLIMNWVEVYRASGVTQKDRIFFAFSFGPFLGFWAAFESATRIGALVLPGGGLNSVARIRMILENEATVLCCTPSYAVHLAEVAAKENLSLKNSQIRAIIVAGEPGGSVPATRLRLESLWPKSTVYDHHGMTETGPVSIPCPLNPGNLHVLESAFVAEILEIGRELPVPAGKTGELTLTNLGRKGSPLIRYRTGDLVQAEARTGPCACGRYDLTLRGGILGRVDDMVVVRGVNVFPSAVEGVLRQFPQIAEFQVTLDRRMPLPELSIAIEPSSDPKAGYTDLAQRTAAALEAAFTLRIPVEVVAPGTLPRFEHKARRWTVVC